MKKIINAILKPFKKQICIECGKIIDRGYGNYKNYCKTCKMKQYRRMKAIKNERRET
jgi:predicted  nucleic acid-binding Zn-ribbon protein